MNWAVRMIILHTQNRSRIAQLGLVITYTTGYCRKGGSRT